MPALRIRMTVGLIVALAVGFSWSATDFTAKAQVEEEVELATEEPAGCKHTRNEGQCGQNQDIGAFTCGALTCYQTQVRCGDMLRCVASAEGEGGFKECATSRPCTCVERHYICGIVPAGGVGCVQDGPDSTLVEIPSSQAYGGLCPPPEVPPEVKE